jgi:hypothetical protein
MGYEPESREAQAEELQVRRRVIEPPPGWAPEHFSPEPQKGQDEHPETSKGQAPSIPMTHKERLAILENSLATLTGVLPDVNEMVRRVMDRLNFHSCDPGGWLQNPEAENLPPFLTLAIYCFLDLHSSSVHFHTYFERFVEKFKETVPGSEENIAYFEAGALSAQKFVYTVAQLQPMAKAFELYRLIMKRCEEVETEQTG